MYDSCASFLVVIFFSIPPKDLKVNGRVWPDFCYKVVLPLKARNRNGEGESPPEPKEGAWRLTYRIYGVSLVMLSHNKNYSGFGTDTGALTGTPSATV